MFNFMRVRSRQAVNLLQRFGPLKRCQDRSYARAAGHYNEGENAPELMQDTISSYRPLLFFAIPTALVGVLGVASNVHQNDEKRAIAKGESTRREVSSVRGSVTGGPFTLINTKREAVTEQNLMGKWALLYFGHTSSPDVGPAEVQKMAEAIDVLESEQNVKLHPVFITIDPQRDSPSQLDAYLREFNSRIMGLTGPVSSIRQMAQQYRVFFRSVEEEGNDYLVDTSHNMHLMNPHMEMVRSFGTEYSAADLVEEIAQEMKKNAT